MLGKKCVNQRLLVDTQRWNKAAMCKLLWNLCSKKEKLWVIWVHAYYIKQGSVWEVKCKQASWVVKKILNAKRYLDDINWVEQDLEQMDNFSVKRLGLYEDGRGASSSGMEKIHL